VIILNSSDLQPPLALDFAGVTAMPTDPNILPLDAHNQTLIANVHPRDWVNPQPRGRYNLVVIGAGTAGLVAAAGAAGLGAKVALIERHLMGGDCLNVGCVPSKAIIRASRAWADARNSGEFGVQGGETRGFDFARAMERMRRLRSGISRHDSVHRFRDELGVDVFIGQGRFVGPDCIEVDGHRLLFDRAALCTGARAAAPAIPGLEAAGCLTNETLFELTELPPRLAVIGGGPIGCEMAQAFARFGSRVSLIQHGRHLLSREDADAAEILHAVFVREGIDLRLGVEILGIETNGKDKILHLDQGGAGMDVTVDAILVAVGRAPNIEGLDLDKTGIAFDRTGVWVNDMLQTTNPRVYAAGDICSPYKFTHTADAQARILIANALFMGRQKVSSLTIPWCTYTDPEIAHVGLTERDAEKKGLALTTLTVPLSTVDRAILDGETEGFARVHLRKGTDKILGATLVARHAGEMISEITLAITGGLGLGAIGRTIHPYPTQAEAMKKLADAHNRTRLTGWVRKALGLWLRWRRR
jgi:pyruvate/2-oxoglutarate dehydrogenase complex dihydrolipoamide dehydrogenase (E3) component